MAPSLSGVAMITALFKDEAGIERAYRAALARGYERDDINLVLSEETRLRHFKPGQVGSELADKAAQSTEKKQPDATELGGPAGGTAATIAPVIAAIGTVTLLPGLILAGPVAVALAAAGAVGIAGGLIGALTNWGIPKSRVEDYETHVRDGGILIGVKPRSEEDARSLEQEWIAAGGAFVQS